MGTVVVRNSVAKRVIVTLMPAISFLCMFGLAAISVNFLCNAICRKNKKYPGSGCKSMHHWTKKTDPIIR